MKAKNLFGDEQEMPEDCGPSAAWIEGWDDYMEYGESTINPYSESEEPQEYRDWQDGFEAAERD